MATSSGDANYNPYYTICLDLKDRPCLVVGGGDVARRKAASLVDAKAKLNLIAPKLDPVLEYMSFQKEFDWIERDFEPTDVEGMFLVIAATDSRDVNASIAELCKSKDILCNIVDDPEESDFINPSAIERGPLTIAISTSGISPSLASCIRQEMEMVYGEEYGQFLVMMSRIRPMVLREFPYQQHRQKIFDRMVASRAISLLRSGMAEEAQRELERMLDEARRDESLKSGPSLPLA